MLNDQMMLFQMDSEGGGTDYGEIGEKTELNILQGFDFDINSTKELDMNGTNDLTMNILQGFDFDPGHDATWLLTSPIKSPRAGTIFVVEIWEVIIFKI